MSVCSMLLASLPALLAFSSGVVTTQYPVIEQEHNYLDGETTLHGHLMYQDIPGQEGDFSRAGLLIFPYFMGAPAMTDRALGRSYAEKGMVVFVADYYGKQYDDSNTAHIEEALTGTYPAFLADSERAERVALLSLEQLTAVPSVDPERVGVIGFCMGGSMASVLARAGGKAQVAVSLHGDNSPAEDASSAPYDIAYFASFFGRNDPMIPPSNVEDSTQWLADSTADGEHDGEVVVYTNTVHAFSIPMSEGILAFLDAIGYGGAAAYSEKRATSSFERVDSLFREYGLLE